MTTAEGRKFIFLFTRSIFLLAVTPEGVHSDLAILNEVKATSRNPGRKENKKEDIIFSQAISCSYFDVSFFIFVFYRCFSCLVYCLGSGLEKGSCTRKMRKL